MIQNSLPKSEALAAVIVVVVVGAAAAGNAVRVKRSRPPMTGLPSERPHYRHSRPARRSASGYALQLSTK